MRYLNAFNEARWDDFAECLDESFVYFTDNCTVRNKEQFTGFMKNSSWKSAGYKIADLNIILSDEGSMAAARYRAEFNGSDNGTAMKVAAVETTLFQKKAGQWKIVHSHTGNKVV